VAQLLVRNVDPEAVTRLKARTREGGRSLQTEIRSYLALAEASRCRLVIADRRLANALAGGPLSHRLLWAGDVGRSGSIRGQGSA
jgi:plasmid stability protein